MKTEHRSTKNFSRLSLICVIFLVIFLPRAAVYAAPESGRIVISAAEQYNYARQLMDEGRYPTAAVELERLIHFFPDHSLADRALLLLGICRMEENRMDEARGSFAEAAMVAGEGPEAAWARLMTGETYYRQGLLAEAAQWFGYAGETADRTEVEDAARYRLGWTLLREGRWSDASYIFGEVSPSSPLHPSAAELSARSPAGYDLPRKDPLTAGTLAALIPGLGHAYVTRYRDATVAFVLNGLFIWATVEAFNRDHNALGVILGILGLGWYTGNIYSAVNVAHKYNARMQDDFRRSLDDRFDATRPPPVKGSLGISISFRF